MKMLNKSTTPPKIKTASYANLRSSEKKKMMKEAASKVAESQQKVYKKYEEKYGKLPSFNFSF